MLIQSGDVTLSAEVAGEGPLVILMHGWPELGLSWRHQVAPLVSAGWRVAVPDMRGYGASDKPADIEAYSLDVLADDMAAMADHVRQVWHGDRLTMGRAARLYAANRYSWNHVFDRLLGEVYAKALAAAAERVAVAPRRFGWRMSAAEQKRRWALARVE